MTSSPELGEVLTLLSRISDQLKALPEAIASAERRHRTPRRLSRSDEALLAALLPVIHAAVGNRTFSVRELIQHAELDLAPAIALRAALASIEGGPRKIGRLLSRGADVAIEGFRVAANGASREGMLWTITTVHRETRSHD